MRRPGAAAVAGGWASDGGGSAGRGGWCCGEHVGVRVSVCVRAPRGQDRERAQGRRPRGRGRHSPRDRKEHGAVIGRVGQLGAEVLGCGLEGRRLAGLHHRLLAPARPGAWKWGRRRWWAAWPALLAALEARQAMHPEPPHRKAQVQSRGPHLAMRSQMLGPPVGVTSFQLVMQLCRRGRAVAWRVA